MKLLMVATVPQHLRAFHLPIAEHFREKGFKVDAASRGITDWPELANGFDHCYSLSFSRNPLHPANFLKAVPQIRALVSQNDYDLVHVHTPVASLLTRYALRALRVNGRPKVLYTAHGFHFSKGGNFIQNQIFLSLEKLGGRWTDYLVVINQEDYNAAIAHQIVPPENLVYMPGVGLDLEKYAAGKVSDDAIARVRGELGLCERTPLLLMVAEFSGVKKHVDALRAFARLRHSDAHLLLAGEGTLLAKMRTLAEKLGIAERVHFLGFRCDIPVLLRAVSASLLVSAREGLPKSVMESLCMEVPVVGTDVRGVRDLLQDGCGLLVKVGDVEGIAKAMDWMIGHPAEAAEMGRRGRMKMQKYSSTNVIRVHEELYDRALSAEFASPVLPPLHFNEDYSVTRPFISSPAP